MSTKVKVNEYKRYFKNNGNKGIRERENVTLTV